MTVREGRYVIPVRREGRGHVGGVIHDESATGATVFVEPPVAVESMNELRDLRRSERGGIQRILRSFSDQLRARVRELAAALDGLGLGAGNKPIMSAHPGVAHVLFADGGVRGLNESINFNILMSLADRRDGNVISDDF